MNRPSLPGRLQPPFPYYGAKQRMAEQIVAILPKHRVYIEPFFGSGAVLFAKKASRFEIVNDLDDAIVGFFQVLRNRPEELARLCALSPHARSEYRASTLNTDEELNELERARRFWVRVNQSFAKTAGPRTGWSLTTARTQAVPASIAARLARFDACARRLAGVSIECCEAAELVRRMATSSDAVVYADPPYVASSRSPRTTKAYRCDMADEAHHRDLAEALRATPATVILSGYPSPLYDELYHDWARIEIATTSQNSSGRKGSRQPRTEVLWTNRPLTTQLDFEDLRAS